MGSAKRNHPKSTANLRTRTTRSSKGRLLTDPNENTQLLTSQLRALGLYAAPTLGDGNCLFRALSDQYYGSPSKHVEVRQNVCDWIEQHKERYEGFVDEDEFGGGGAGGKGKVEVYLRRMRENATYGGHMELSAFAHLARRNIKVVQPGLVYIIQWDPTPTKREEPTDEDMDDEDDDLEGMNERDKRRIRRERQRARKEKRESEDESDDEDNEGPIYVAYHDWEHFSSIRNLKGPHTGLPHIHETPVDSSSPEPPKSKGGGAANVTKIKLKLSQPTPTKPSSSRSSKPKSKSSSDPVSRLRSDPSQIPLPPSISASPCHSRSLSPMSSSLSPTPECLPSTSSQPIPASAINSVSVPSLSSRMQRSPKRSFDESSASSEGGGGLSESSNGKSKRSRVSSVLGTPARVGLRSQRTPPTTKDAVREDDDLDIDVEAASDDSDASDDETSLPRTMPFLSPPSSASNSSSSLSSIPAEPEPEPEPQAKPLTRRQRKKLGLPKPRMAGAGKIVIPGGKFRGKVGVREGEEEGDEGDVNIDSAEWEWRRNGAGRVDVRGFRELKI